MPLIWFRLVAGGVAVLLVTVIVIVIVRGGAAGGKATPGPVKTWISPVDGMVMVYVPEGTFWMGSSMLDLVARDEKPQHEVYLDAFWIDRTEVTNAMFARFVTDTGYETDAERRGESLTIELGSQTYGRGFGVDWQHPNGSSTSIVGLDEHPVVQVSWNDAAAYCRWAHKRLPTEAEWEKAARGTDGLIYPWGNTFDGRLVNSCDINCKVSYKDKNSYDGYAGTAPVGSYVDGASPYGALDMAGNVMEWTADRYAEDYYATSPDSNPQGPSSGEGRVQRGGSWLANGRYVRAACRSGFDPFYSYYHMGFRCVRSVSNPSTR